MNDQPQTWHYGLVARYWAEHNTTGPEIAYFQQQIERYGQPALDAGCGTGRLLIPFLRAGLDVDGCDVSPDMLALCREKAGEEGLAPRLYRQALHQLDLPRTYQTIVACGVFGIGVSRQQDFAALQRFHHHLAPGGVLLLEQYLPYGDAKQWPFWRQEQRQQLPEAWPETLGQEPPEGGSEYQLYSRLVDLDPLEQQVTLQMRTLLWRDGQVVDGEEYTLTENLYFCHELRMLLEQAGFEVEAVRGGYTQDAATADDNVMVFVARRP
jgi:SAM-dependent methyltransferase